MLRADARAHVLLEAVVEEGGAAEAAGADGGLLDAQRLERHDLVGDEVDGAAAGVADDEVVADAQVVRLDGLEGVDGGGLGLRDHLDVVPGAHAGLLGGEQGRVLCGVGPHGGARQDELDLGGGHEGRAVAAGQGVHGVRVDLGEVVGDGVDDGLVVLLELGGRVLGGDVEGQFLGAVEEELHAAEARLGGGELEAPAGLERGRGGGGGRGGRGRGRGRRDVGDFRGDLVARDAVAPRPRLDDLDIIRRGRIHRRHAIRNQQGSSNSPTPQPVAKHPLRSFDTPQRGPLTPNT